MGLVEDYSFSARIDDNENYYDFKNIECSGGFEDLNLAEQLLFCKRLMEQSIKAEFERRELEKSVMEKKFKENKTFYDVLNLLNTESQNDVFEYALQVLAGEDGE